jgi:hypothetical protein
MGWLGKMSSDVIRWGSSAKMQHMRLPYFRSGLRVLMEMLEPRRLLSSSPIEIDGVQMAAMDLARVYFMMQRNAGEEPLNASGGYAVGAFLDTGASGNLTSLEYADVLGLQREPGVTFADVGVGGFEGFDVSESIRLGVTGYPPESDAIEHSWRWDEAFEHITGPLRIQVNRHPTQFLYPINIIGMPAMEGKVVVFDPRPVEDLSDYIHTFIYNPGRPYDPDNRWYNPGIPPTNVHVPLHYASFERFTFMDPANAPRPKLADNPFIGGDPLAPLTGAPVDPNDRVILSHNGSSSGASLLLDTGAMASFISSDRASDVGVFYADDTYGTDEARLIYADGSDVPNQFQLAIGGIGGSITVAGFYLNSLHLPTAEGGGITYHNAPVLVLDVTVVDPVTDETLTLDGAVGFNMLVASARVEGGWPTHIVAGPYEFVVFDQPAGLLALDFPFIDNPGTTAFAQSFEYNTGPHEITMRFTRDVGSSLSADDLVLQNLSTGQTIASSQLSLSYDPVTRVAIFTVTRPSGLPNGNYRATLAAGSVSAPDGTPMVNDATLDFFFLQGDANRDRFVNVLDFNILVQNFARTDATFSMADFNGDGIVNVLDFNLLVHNFGQNVPPPAVGGSAGGSSPPPTRLALQARWADASSPLVSHFTTKLIPPAQLLNLASSETLLHETPEEATVLPLLE